MLLSAHLYSAVVHVYLAYTCTPLTMVYGLYNYCVIVMMHIKDTAWDVNLLEMHIPTSVL